MMRAWHEAAARRGARHAFLEVAADNTAARALYACLEYEVSGLRRAYYKRPGGGAADAVIMTRALTLG